MKNKEQNVWTGIEHLNPSPEFLENANQEFLHGQEEIPIPITEQSLSLSSNRRDFLKYLGFGIGAATIAASCEIPVKRALPYVTKPDTIVPGVANYYASSFVKGGDYCSILVKTREGRPIKIEGNSLSPVTKGGTNARTQASVLDLYDTNRYQTPKKVESGKVKEVKWADLDRDVMAKLNSATGIRILSNTILSPTAKKAIGEFTTKYPNAKWVSYDPVSASGLLDANLESFGDRVVPAYSFDKANVIVGFDCDFLGTWISPIEYAAQYATNRRVEDVKAAKMSRHYQVESHMSLTGSNADNRILVKPSEQGAAIAALYNAVASQLGSATISGPKLNDKASKAMAGVAKDLIANKGASLVVSGSNNKYEQILVNKINDLLGNYGATISFNNASLQRTGDDAALQQLVSEMNAGSVGVLIVIDANPVYDLPNGEQFKQAMAKVGLKVSTAAVPSETAVVCDYIAPAYHYLESWADAEPKRGSYSLIQPTISPLFDTRQFEASLLVWAASPAYDTKAEQPYYEYLKSSWQSGMFGQQKAFSTFQSFWDSTLHDGILENPKSSNAGAFRGEVADFGSKLTQPSSSELEISFYETINVGDGSYATNPWLQELPDPVTRTVWGNYLAVPVGWKGEAKYDTFKGLKDGDLVDLEVNGKKLRVPVITQFGQMPGTLGLALGYGRTEASVTGKNVGVNSFNMASVVNGATAYSSDKVKVSGKVGTEKDFSCVQYHHTMGVTGTDNKTKQKINVDELAAVTLGAGYQGSIVPRTIIRKAHVSEVSKFAETLHEERLGHQALNAKTLYRKHDEKYKTGIHWGMHIDLNSCIGCGACSVACMSENNVPVVGKHEVHRHHEMSWLRIDRYFYGTLENPNTVYQPMMCQHCDNAPCENVCPVAATNHSMEGINQMTYNRCIGTRYCANNCPYKVRRFNWLDYTTADLFPSNEYSINNEKVRFGADNLTRMVLNPDVTVRTRGVIEKCSFCIQRVQEGKLTAKSENRQLRDGDVKSACMTACPTGAITFGNINDPESAVSKKNANSINYLVLEEVNVAPNVMYSAKIINSNESLDA
ncbi:MAG TPA: TAT-variant-translocated molybdopterin oxidoreductase [Saprospiraceae bacterium]|nr:TAT-variant-translocated molybdopterin oxidoreductase [Saprospiraceae bacterium]